MDHAVGVSGLVKIGEQVGRGQPLALLQANDAEKLTAARALLQSAFRLTTETVSAPPLIMEEMTP